MDPYPLEDHALLVNNGIDTDDPARASRPWFSYGGMLTDPALGILWDGSIWINQNASTHLTENAYACSAGSGDLYRIADEITSVPSRNFVLENR